MLVTMADAWDVSICCIAPEVAVDGGSEVRLALTVVAGPGGGGSCLLYGICGRGGWQYLHLHLHLPDTAQF